MNLGFSLSGIVELVSLLHELPEGVTQVRRPLQKPMRVPSIHLYPSISIHIHPSQAADTADGRMWAGEHGHRCRHSQCSAAGRLQTHARARSPCPATPRQAVEATGGGG